MKIKRNNEIRIEGRRIYLRPYVHSDAAEISRVAGNRCIYETTYNMPIDFSKSYAEWWINFLKNTMKNSTGYEFGIFDAEDHSYIGHCGINNISRSCHHGNLVYFISPDYWNRGIATEAARLIVSFGFENLALYRISGICMSHNDASARVLEKVGMRYEGLGRAEIFKDGKYVDVKHYALLKDDLPV